MKHVKLFEQFINEAKEDSGNRKPTNQNKMTTSEIKEKINAADKNRKKGGWSSIFIGEDGPVINFYDWGTPKATIAITVLAGDDTVKSYLRKIMLQLGLKPKFEYSVRGGTTHTHNWIVKNSDDFANV